jgi:hypothetical protein
MKYIISILFLFLTYSVSGQLQTSFNFGGIALDQNSSNSFSGPLAISNDKNCLQLFNGIQVFSATSKGGALFNPICESNIRELKPLLIIAPNPSRGLAKLYLINNGFLSDDKVTVVINDITGKVVHEYLCNGAQLKEGFSLNTNGITNGMYFVKVVAKFNSNSGSLISQSFTSLKLINTDK